MTLAPILSNLINKSLAQGLFPLSLKRAEILPIFKSKDKQLLNIANYSPLSILPVISIVMEKFFVVDSMTIFPQIIYYHPPNLASDQEQALNMLYENSLTIF